MAKSRESSINESIALQKRVSETIKLPPLALDGAGIMDLIAFIDRMKELNRWCDEVWQIAGVFAEPESGFGVFCKQPGFVIDIIGSWASEQAALAYKALEAKPAEGSIYQSYRLEKLLAYYASAEEFEKCRELLMLDLPDRPKSGIPVDARDRLDDGINILHTAWLAMAGDTMEDSQFSKDREAVTDSIWQALTKFGDAKSQLAAAAEGRAAA